MQQRRFKHEYLILACMRDFGKYFVRKEGNCGERSPLKYLGAPRCGASGDGRKRMQDSMMRKGKSVAKTRAPRVGSDLVALLLCALGRHSGNLLRGELEIEDLGLLKGIRASPRGAFPDKAALDVCPPKAPCRRALSQRSQLEVSHRGILTWQCRESSDQQVCPTFTPAKIPINRRALQSSARLRKA
eukprot:3568762-Pleurochrysis_carterae.AAC.3